MIVHVHEDSSISLDDPNTFTAFSVRAPGRALEQVVAAFGDDAAAGDGNHVWISISRLHALGALHGAADWRRGCDGMLAFAASKGWVDEKSRRVRAHFEA